MTQDNDGIRGTKVPSLNRLRQTDRLQMKLFMNLNFNDLSFTSFNLKFKSLEVYLV